MARKMKPPSSDAPLLQRRVYARLLALDIGPTQVPGLEKNFIPDLFRLNRPKRQVLGDNLKRLAQGLQCTPEYLTVESVDDPSGGIDAFTERLLRHVYGIRDAGHQEMLLTLADQLQRRENSG